jgi:hypothetical protein
MPMASATSETSAPVASHTADIVLILEILCAVIKSNIRYGTYCNQYGLLTTVYRHRYRILKFKRN